MVDLNKKHSPLLLLFAKIAAALLALAVLAGAGRFAYYRYFPDILVARARSAFARDDLKNATLLAQRAYQIRNKDVDAMRLLADITEKSGLYVALEWRKVVLDADPDSLPDILACANTALHCNQPAVAKEVLSKAQGASSNARYWSLNASVDVALGKFDDAERDAVKAVLLDPGNLDSQFTLAAVRLKIRHLEIRDEARASLENLAKTPRLHLAAERLLIEDSISNGELTTAVKIGEAVIADPKSQYFDKLIYLAALQKAGDPRFHDYLSRLQTESGANPPDAAVLIAWMDGNGMASQAYGWAATLPPSFGRGTDAGPSIAHCYLDTGHYQALYNLLKEGSWGKSEYLRHAFLARACEQIGNNIEYQLDSEKAMAETGADSAGDRNLSQLELEWGWEGPAQRTLARIVKTAESKQDIEWALDRLYPMYVKQGNVDLLAEVTAKLAELHPRDDLVQNNYVMFSLLTKKDLIDIYPVAEGLYRRHLDNPVFVSTYAYSLLLQGEKEKARTVIMSLSEAERRAPSVAPYCGIILAAAKEKESARAYLDLVDESKLFPPEIVLVENARAQAR